MPSNYFKDDARMEYYYRLAAETEINAFVVDIKDDNGWITYDTQLEQPREYRAVDVRLGDLRELADNLRDKGIYSIGRLVVFKDSKLAQARHDVAVLNAGGGLWTDGIRSHWVDPYHPETWEYNIRVAEEVIRLGFDEVQFDYIRFPSDGRLSAMVFPSRHDRLPRSRIIADFLKTAHWQVLSAGGRSSSDVFGLVTTTVDDMGIGQRWEEMTAYSDFVSPMIYPSHYGPNIYGLPSPNAAPYETVYHAMKDATRRTGSGDSGIRPWLQDFSWGHRYGPAEVRGQIEAGYEHGVESWLLWNQGGVFTEGALKPADSE